MDAVGVADHAPLIGMKAGVDELPVALDSEENGSTPTPELTLVVPLLDDVVEADDEETDAVVT